MRKQLTKQVIKLLQSSTKIESLKTARKVETLKKVERYRLTYKKIKVPPTAQPKTVITPPPFKNFNKEDFETILAVIPKDNVYKSTKPSLPDLSKSSPKLETRKRPHTAHRLSNRIVIPPPQSLDSLLQPRPKQVKAVHHHHYHGLEDEEHLPLKVLMNENVDENAPIEVLMNKNFDEDKAEEHTDEKEEDFDKDDDEENNNAM